MPESELIDDDVVYCTGDDVLTHVRNKRYDDLSDDTKPSKKQVDRLIFQFSEWADTFTGQAWRTRRSFEREYRVKFSRKQKSHRHRRRSRRTRGGRVETGVVDARGRVTLKHPFVLPIDPEEGDVVEALRPRSTVDVTEDEGREAGKYVVDYREGILKPNVELFTITTVGRVGDMTTDPRIRVSYRYGRIDEDAEPDPEEYDFADDAWYVSPTVPGDVRDAVALRCAARILSGDQYGESTPSGGENAPSLAEAASGWKEEATGLLKPYKRRR